MGVHWSDGDEVGDRVDVEEHVVVVVVEVGFSGFVWIIVLVFIAFGFFLWNSSIAS